MKKLLVLLCALLLIFGVTGVVGATQLSGTPSPSLSPVFGTLIDFDDKATGTEVLWNDYVSLGVASITETSGIGQIWRSGGSQSQPNYVGTGVDNGWDGTILIEFSGLASMVGIGIADGIGEEYITAYDSDFNLLESYSAPSGSNVYTGIDREGIFDIKFFEIVGDFFAIDDLQHNATGAPVPEPTTMLLFGSGLIGLGIFGRKKLFKK